MPSHDFCEKPPGLDYWVRNYLAVIPVEHHLEKVKLAEALIIALERVVEVEGGGGPTVKAIARALMLNDGSDLMRRLMEDEPAKETRT